MRGSEMRRRAPEYRRQSRRRLPGWIWWLVGIFLVVGLMLFVLHHNQKEQFRPPVIVSSSNMTPSDFLLADLCGVTSLLGRSLPSCQF
uniref:Hexosyltransferase n=1 Tax=Aegilops tauschii subsp. strangulata TaxID=200361 RepID=A0A453HZ34_AEGTS